MRRSICYCNPNHALAGEIRTWKFIYTTASPLPKGTKLKFDLQTKGRAIDWEIPTANLKKKKNVLYAILDNGKILQAKEIELPDSFAPQYEFSLLSEIPAGGNFTIVCGSANPEDANPNNGTQAQTHSHRRRSFLLYIDTTGKRNYSEPEVFSLDVRGNELQSIRVLAPSFVSRNKRFDVTVRFEDEFGNLTSKSPDDTLVELSYENLRENLNWKLFVPETGFLTLPNLYFNEAGIYTIKLLNTMTKEIFKSCPIKCFNENNKHLYWGILHGESEKIDSTENIENCLRHIRDEKALNFFASSPFEPQEETPNEVWKHVTQNLAEFDENERFITFTGFQWNGTQKEEGLRHFIYLKDGKQILRKKDPKYSSLSKIYRSFSPKEILSIPSFTMGKGFEYNFENFSPEFERVVEIYNAWGSSECSLAQGNTVPITTEGKKGVFETAEGSIQKALEKNLRFGFVAGGLDDRGIYADLFDGDQVQYHPGLTAIIAQDHSRSALAEALYQRSCYATTGPRIILGLYIAGAAMGKEINTADKPGLLVNRHLSGYAAGSTKLEKIEIIRNGKVLKTFTPEGYNTEFTFDDLEPLSKCVINTKDTPPPFVYYYLRVTQEDGHIGWSSPIWVDLVPPNPNKKPAGKADKNTKKKPTPTELEDDDDEDDSFDDEESSEDDL